MSKKKLTGKCCVCGNKSNLELHHILYTNKYDELYRSKENLIIICHNCHHNYHQKYNYNLSFKTLMEFARDYWKNHCPKLKKENNKLHEQNSALRKRIRELERI